MSESLTEHLCMLVYGLTLVFIAGFLTYASATYFPYHLFLNQGGL